MVASKKVLTLFLVLVIVFSLTFVLAINNTHHNNSNNSSEKSGKEKDNDGKREIIKAYNECKNQAELEKRHSYKSCKEAFDNSSSLCKTTFKECKDNINNLTNETEIKTAKNKCRTDYLLCERTAVNTMLECRKSSREAYKQSDVQCKEERKNSCLSNTDCQEGSFCSKNSCGDLSGQCLQKPAICSAVFIPVCGCDNVTYGNECEAMKAGVSQDHVGTCSP